MSRTVITLTAISCLLAGGLAGALVTRPQPGVSAEDVRAIVTEMTANSTTTPQADAPMSMAELDPETLHPMIESYLLNNPRILEKMSTALQAELQAEEAERTRLALASLQDEIYDDADHVVVGNPDGDVTLVEMFDYNCGYCRSALPDLASLIEDDSNLKVILKEFPILSRDSVEAARVAVAVNRAGGDYWAFHTTLFTGRGQVTAEAALDVAEQMGMDRAALEADAATDEVALIVQRSYDIAQALDISGTPSYILGDEVIPGAIGLDGLKERIANLRACGSTVCDG